MVTCLFCIIHVSNSSPKNLNVVLASNWNSTSILLEVGEFVAHNSNHLYWQYIDAVAEGFMVWKGGQFTHQDEYTLALQIMNTLVSNSIINVLEFSLAIHHYSPQLQVYRTLHDDLVTRLDTKIDWDSCPVVVAYGPSKAVCGLDNFDFTSLKSSSLEIFEFDKVHPSSPASLASVPTVILYADITQAEKFLNVHKKLLEQSKAQKIRYVFRPKVPVSTAPILLQGFGIELAIKNMEYKVLDDSKIEIDETELGTGENLMFSEDDEESDVNGFYFKRLAERHPDIADGLAKFKESLLASSQEDAKVNVWDMNNLGLAAAQKIMRSSKPFELLREISQNFPAYASPLTRVRLDSNVRKFLTRSRDVDPGSNKLSINGIKVDIKNEINIFSLQSLLQAEATTIDKMQNLNMPLKDIKHLMSLPIAIDESSRTNMGIGTELADEAITFLNDISHDRKYISWSSSIHELLAPGWPGTLKYVRKNLYTGIVIFDASTKDGLERFSEAKYFVEQNAPFRMGVLFYIPQSTSLSSTKKEILEKCTKNDKKLLQSQDSGSEPNKKKEKNLLSASIAKLFHYLVEENDDTSQAFKFLQKLADKKRDVDVDDVKVAFLKYSGSKNIYQKVINGENGEDFVKKNQEYLSKRGFQQILQKDPWPLFVVNGKIPTGQKSSFRNMLMKGIMIDQNHLINEVSLDKITERTNMDTYFDKLPSSMPRIAPHILQPLKEMKLISTFPSCQFVTHPDEEFTPKGASYIIVGDFSTLQGLKIAYAGIEHLQNQPKSKLKSRICFVPNPKKDLSHLPRFISGVLTNVVSTKKAYSLVHRAITVAVFLWPNEKQITEVLKQFIKDARLSDKVKGRVSKVLLAKDTPEKLIEVTSSLGISPGENRLLVNGRIITIPEKASINDIIHDLQLSDYFTDQTLNSNKILEVLQTVQFADMEPDDITADWIDNVIMQSSLSLLDRSINIPTQNSNMPEFEDDDITIVGNYSKSLLKVKAILDPLSKAAQWVTPVLMALRDGFGAEVRIMLNPRKDLGKFPLTRFYRFAISPKLHFDSNTGELNPVGVLFKKLNTKSVLTLGIKTPESWMVASKQAHHDLDNIRLEEIGIDTLSVQFELEHLLLSGQCFEKGTFDAPAGLQLDLSRNGKIRTDTTVMRNLGYFQLQSNPGVWSVILHGAEANSIYEIENEDAIVGDAKESSMQVQITSFNAEAVRLSVLRKPGMEEVELGGDNKDKMVNSIWGNFFGSGREKSSSEEVLHVFSLASGHLYERFLKIMMLSVIKNTKSPVKFWFIKNFASPQFKDFAPKMAKHYGYELEFVTYKWPEWLRRQTEKQRIIWGYKILFLDVLFPLNISRIIYIDADQIVRGDIKELWDMDLKGAVYGYTPFCDSNKNTEGFRFWKQGYWKNHLRGSPYHISALYVVDLDLFRSRRAGDSLRMIYDNLSQDPNSLSNLDQDLPNYAQHQVKIFSLPQEWLWCQTWCSMETLATAKTIDLCNNPLTKTPKLEVAKSLLPEWEVYDNEAKDLESELSKKTEKMASHRRLKQEL